MGEMYVDNYNKD